MAVESAFLTAQVRTSRSARLVGTDSVDGVIVGVIRISTVTIVGVILAVHTSIVHPVRNVVTILMCRHTNKSLRSMLCSARNASTVFARPDRSKRSIYFVCYLRYHRFRVAVLVNSCTIWI